MISHKRLYSSGVGAGIIINNDDDESNDDDDEEEEDDRSINSKTFS